jgi:hypothetical protein
VAWARRIVAAPASQAEMAHLTLKHEVAHRSDGVLDRHGRIDTMDVIEVDDIGFEPLHVSVTSENPKVV